MPGWNYSQESRQWVRCDEPKVVEAIMPSLLQALEKAADHLDTSGGQSAFDAAMEQFNQLMEKFNDNSKYLAAAKAREIVASIKWPPPE